MSAFRLIPKTDRVLDEPCVTSSFKSTAGKDVTIVAYSRMVPLRPRRRRPARARRHRRGGQRPAHLLPLDEKTIADSVRKTGRLIVVQECYPRASFSEDIIRRVMEYRFENGRNGFSYLDGIPTCWRRAHAGPDVHAAGRGLCPGSPRHRRGVQAAGLEPGRILRNFFLLLLPSPV